jgi:hypothetical protein
MDQQGILYLSNDYVKTVLDLGRAIEITEQALRDHSAGRVIWSTPEDLAIKPQAGWQSWVTGCALADEPVAGFRIRSIKAAGGSRDLSRAPRGPRRILILSDREAARSAPSWMKTGAMRYGQRLPQPSRCDCSRAKTRRSWRCSARATPLAPPCR